MANTNKKSTSEENTKKKATTKTSSTTTKKKEAPKKTSANSSNTNKENKKVKEEKKVKEIIEEKKEVEIYEDDIEIDDGFSIKKTGTSNVGILIAISLIIILLIVIIALAGSKGKYNTTNTENGGTSSSQTLQGESSSIKDDERNDLKTINIDEYLSLKESNDSYSIIYVARPTCSYCVLQKPIMENVVYRYDITVNYLNTDELSDEDVNKLRDSDEYFEGGWGTPLTLIVRDNKIVDKIEGATVSSNLIELFKKYDIITE